ncbi:DNA-binding transcriptional regulator, LysR family [Variovorax sp. OK605]|jgi:DNA-binding transcriptional LysR family regulator|uniref:LysR family transcriptional regulator n=1 Tax=Variovorax sp. OK605 TaxID=1855317 RepID=UPI0008E9E10E|nr:LysR family transcriptional regulator [Variovorax sp. OK605]SFQ28220.1 DNA-binding transcriptional regulator, LysR family [Variovorax sp. OK605]
MTLSATVLRNRLLSRARLRHLEVFVRTADLGSVKRAAEAIGMAQPTATQALSDLETLLGSALFLRHSKGMSATALGVALLPMARRMLALVDEAATQTVAITSHASSVVRVAANAAGISSLLGDALPAFASAHPDILVQLQEADAANQPSLLTAGEIDCFVCRAPEVLPEGWEFTALQQDRFAVVAAPGHPLARKKRVSLAELEAATWLTTPAPVVARQAFDELFAASAQPPKTCNVLTTSPTMIWALLARKELLALLPRSVVRHLLDGGHLVELHWHSPSTFRDIGMLLPLRERSAALDRFARFLSARSTPARAKLGAS